MADNIFRSLRSRGPVAREEADLAPREGMSDPLAELARLIGQGDPQGETGRYERYDEPQPLDVPPSTGRHWATEDSYASEAHRADDRLPRQTETSPHDHNYVNKGAANGRFSSGSAAPFDGFRERPDDTGYQDEQRVPTGYGAAPALTSEGSDGPYEADEQYDNDAAYAEEAEHPQPNAVRRNGLVLVMAVLALIVVGASGAFAYRAMFGHSMLPSLPPIIKPASGPNKIVPSYGDSQANNSAQPGAPATGTAEKLVSHEEQPVDMPAPQQPAPRVISTIPISPNQGLPQPGAASPAPPVNAATSAGAPALNVFPPPPGSPPQMAATAPPANAPVTAPPGPKKVHTVTIRADQAPAAEPVVPAPTPSVKTSQHAAPKPPRAPAASKGTPLSLVPGPQGDAPAPAPAPTRTGGAAAPMAMANAAPASRAAAEQSSGRGYAVQLTSQHSEADAEAAYRALQLKFPNQLGGHEPIVRRADLGAKGTFYRALVGPFASAEEAGQMCSSLKAAGGTCLVQRN